MITFYTSQKLMSKAPKEIINFLINYLNLNDILSDIIGGETDDLEAYFGGPVHIIEKKIDLNDIQLSGLQYEEPENNLLYHSGYFDDVQWLPDNKYLYIFAANNNNGGPSYFIPETIVKECPSVLETIRINYESQLEEN